MTHPLESLDLTASTTGPSSNLIPLAIMMAIVWAFFFFASAFIWRDSRKHSAFAFSVGIIAIIAAIALTFLPQKNYGYQTFVKIEDISLHSKSADVTFKKGDKIYTATMPKNDAAIISRCNMIKAKRTSYEELKDPRLGTFKINLMDNRCTLKGT